MGSIFSAPKPAIVAPAPVPEPEVDASNSEAEEERARRVIRSNLGRESTIKTSYSGVLSQSSATPQRKTLLGE